jgi:hypothetical protein
MPGKRQKVLYVDMVTSDARLSERYSYRKHGEYTPRNYIFSKNLHLQRPPKREQLIAWLRTAIVQKGVQTVIIDDIRAFSRTCYGTRETLAVMRELKDLTDEFGTSILVLISTPAPTRDPLISDADLRRWSALADVCDSVFGLGRHPRAPGSRYLLQTRSRHGRMVWNEQNAPVSTIGVNDENMLAHLFDGRFAATISPEQRIAICRIKAMRANGLSFRKIAERMDMPVTRVRRWFDMWKSDMEVEGETRNAECGTRNEKVESENFTSTGQLSGCPKTEPEEYEEAGFERPPWLDEERNGELRIENGQCETGKGSAVAVATAREGNRQVLDDSRTDLTRGDDTALGSETIINSQLSIINHSSAQVAETRQRTIHDLEMVINEYGRPRYIEERFPNGQLRIFYDRERDGRLIKRVAGTFGPTITDLGKTDFL